jgi:hypothetical protein
MKNFLILMSLVICSLTASAKDTIIAQCLAPAQGNNPEIKITVLRKGNVNSKGAMTVLYQRGSAAAIPFVVDELQWLDQGKTMAIRFANFVLAWIHNGQSKDSKLGVALGAPPVVMSCTANF